MENKDRVIIAKRTDKENIAVAPPKKRSRQESIKDDKESKAVPQKRGNQDSTPRDATNDSAKNPFDMRRCQKPPLVKRLYDEVRSCEHETVEELQARVDRRIAEATEQGVDVEWEIEHVVGLTENGKKAIVKYADYSIPSLVPLQRNFLSTTTNHAFVDARNRVEIFKQLARQLKRELGQVAFAAAYPHWHAHNEAGYGESTFVQNQLTLHINKVRAYEAQLTAEADRVHQPALIVVDASGKMGALPGFKYTHKLLPSKKVLRGMARSSDLAAIKCNDKCNSGQPCTSLVVLDRKATTDRHCGCTIRDGNYKHWSAVECVDDCSCDADTCENNVVQKGRQIELILFNDHRKGWTIRAASHIQKGSFITEYAGEVITHYESCMRPDNTYFMDMPCQRVVEHPETKKRTVHEKLVIDAREYANEASLFSHSCNPNLVLVPVYVERVGEWFARMIFIAKKDIKAGEELSFDYFPNHTFAKRKQNANPLFEKCLCGHRQCHFSEELKGRAAKLQEELLNGTIRSREKEQAEIDGDSWSEDEEDDLARDVRILGERN